MDNFTVFGHRHKTAIKRALRYSVQEPAEGVDVAEEWLARIGHPGQSWCEIVFNGNTHPHTSVFLLEDNTLGILNHENAQWPVFYSEGDGFGTVLETAPFDTGQFENAPEDAPKHEKDENADKMDLGGEDEADDQGSEDASEPDDDYGDLDTSDEGEDEADDDSEAPGDEQDDEDETENDGEADYDGEQEKEDADYDGDAETEKEDELPRLNIFAKLRTPKGWRKRAEIDTEKDRNTFALKVGVVEEGPTASKQEQNVVAFVEFVENDLDHAAGLLRVRMPKLPRGTQLDDLEMDFTKSGWLTIHVPYYDQEN